jgi:hypothetical protein
MPCLRSLSFERCVMHALACLGALLLAPMAIAQSSIAYRLSFPADIARVQYIAPGQVGDFAFIVTSVDTAPGSALIRGPIYSESVTLTEYTFSSSDPARCTLPTIPENFIIKKIAFVVGPIAPGEILTCRYRVTRATLSINDLGVSACPSNLHNGICDVTNTFFYGNLPDLALSVEQVLPTPAGSSEPIFRLQLTNHSNETIPDRTVTTECSEFNGGLFDPVPYIVESDFAGGCATSQTSICINFTGQSYTNFAFDFGTIPAGGSTSCLVRLRHHPSQSATPSTNLHLLSSPPSFFDPLVVLSNGGIAIDPDSANDRATLALASSGGAAPIPMSLAGLLMLALLLGLVGLSSAKRAAYR